jgi:putative endopeptidase
MRFVAGSRSRPVRAEGEQMRSPRLLALTAGLILLAAAMSPQARDRFGRQRPSAPPPGASAGAHGLDLAGMDRSVSPGDDFFRFTNGAWARATQIPPDRASYGVGSILDEEALQRTRGLLEAASASKAPAGSDERKIGDYYAAYMDERGIEERGVAPLKSLLGSVAAISDRRGLAEWIGRSLRADVDPLNATNFETDHVFGLWISQDFNHPDQYSPYILQGGLGMPDRQYYLDPSPRMEAIRTSYRAHIAAMLKLAGTAEADAKAARVFDLERRIAQVHATRTDSEDVLKANNPWKREEFATRAPGIDWPALFNAAGLGGAPMFIVWQPGAITGIAALAGNQPLEAWRDFLAFHVVDHYAGVLPRAFVNERFAFHGKTLSGTPQLRDRWKRAVDSTSFALGEAVGKMYVQRYFPPRAKEQAAAMVRDIVTAFGRRIDGLAWMTPKTRASAKAKLSTLKVGIGYPDRWRDYSKLEVVRGGDAFTNLYKAELFDYQYNLGKLGQPVDRSEWAMTPQTVNAVNLPVQNALNFPAAILQPPFFDPAADAAVNYGSIGAVIGHEISHSFDDQGSQFDATGRLANWWTPDDFAHFKAASERLAAQYDAYRPFPDAHVDGHQTLSENIADVAGLSVAYDAYRLSLHGRPGPALQGFSGDQRFFISFAESWREKTREAALRQQLLTDGHAPDEYRADTVRNIDAWYDAFQVKPGQALYLAPGARVRVW